MNFIRNVQDYAVLLAILHLKRAKDCFFTGDTYEEYRKVCKKKNLKPLSIRSVSDRITYFDEMKVIDAVIISNGRYGRTKRVEVKLPDEKLQEILGSYGGC